MPKKKERDFYKEYLNSVWPSVGNDSSERDRVRNNFHKKVKETKSIIKDKDFFKKAKEMFNHFKKSTDFTCTIIASAALSYFIAPIDMIPDFIPIAGYIDDIAVISGAYKEFKKFLSIHELVKG